EVGNIGSQRVLGRLRTVFRHGAVGRETRIVTLQVGLVQFDVAQQVVLLYVPGDFLRVWLLNPLFGPYRRFGELLHRIRIGVDVLASGVEAAGRHIPAKNIDRVFDGTRVGDDGKQIVLQQGADHGIQVGQRIDRTGTQRRDCACAAAHTNE